ncbi:MAG: Gfo/Idh/MocA family oxidoreductase [Deltaproteobacteria bacterium]
MAKKPIRLMVLGTGGMARSHTEAFQKIDGVTIVAGVDTNAERLAKFQADYKVEAGYLTLNEALMAGGFDAVANITPDAAHYSTTMALLNAGLNVLCEKPLATNYANAREMADTAKAKGLVHMVNLTYRNVPSMQHAAKIVRDGAIGEVRHFEASYLQSWLTQAAWGRWDVEDQWLWRLSSKHGSKGVLGDVGIHILDFATHVAGLPVTEVSAKLKTFHKAPGDQIGPYVLDANDSCLMNVELGNGAIGTVHASRFASGHLNDLQLRIFGTKGGLDVRWIKNVSTLFACTGDLTKADWTEVKTPDVPTNYERFIAALRGEKHDGPGFDRGAELQAVLDAAESSDAQKGLTQTL